MKSRYQVHDGPLVWQSPGEVDGHAPGVEPIDPLGLHDVQRVLRGVRVAVAERGHVGAAVGREGPAVAAAVAAARSEVGSERM